MIDVLLRNTVLTTALSVATAVSATTDATDASSSGTAWSLSLVQAALVIFVVVFVALGVNTLRRSRGACAHAASLPLHDSPSLSPAESECA